MQVRQVNDLVEDDLVEQKPEPERDWAVCSTFRTGFCNNRNLVGTILREEKNNCTVSDE